MAKPPTPETSSQAMVCVALAAQSPGMGFAPKGTRRRQGQCLTELPKEWKRRQQQRTDSNVFLNGESVEC